MQALCSQANFTNRVKDQTSTGFTRHDGKISHYEPHLQHRQELLSNCLTIKWETNQFPKITFSSIFPTVSYEKSLYTFKMIS